MGLLKQILTFCNSLLSLNYNIIYLEQNLKLAFQWLMPEKQLQRNKSDS